MWKQSEVEVYYVDMEQSGEQGYMKWKEAYGWGLSGYTRGRETYRQGMIVCVVVSCARLEPLQYSSTTIGDGGRSEMNMVYLYQ